MDYMKLEEVVAGGFSAIRLKMKLQPAGGPGTKLFPPTHSVDNESLYAWEERLIDENKVPCVLLDSVQSQANRMELALKEALDEKHISIPVIQVDFSSTGFPDLETITSLETPHRIADAIFRDSLTEDGQDFRASQIGQAFEETTPRKATALFGCCPTALVFGVWNSTGSQGGMGTKFQRTVVSEIAGINAVPGVATVSRMDPLKIKKIEVFKGQDTDWTLNEAEAAKRKGKPVILKASDINHSNIPPTIIENHGGVTVDHGELTFVLSLPALRRLHFPLDGEEKAKPEVNTAARTTLAALALAAITLEIEQGFDLRSRCLLLCQETPQFELIDNYGETESFSLDSSSAINLLNEAVSVATSLGLPWETSPVTLKPSDKLIGLISKNRATESADEE